MLTEQHDRGPGQFLTVGQAANYLGISPWTLRNWDRTGKLKPVRHPISGYRIYRHEELEAILAPTSSRATGPAESAAAIDWNALTAPEHFIEFYERDSSLMDSVGRFIGAALDAGAGGI